MAIDNNSSRLVENLRIAERRIAQAKGDFTLFVLFELDQMPGKWDLIVAAPWLNTNRAGIETLVNLIRPDMSSEDWLLIATVIPLQPDTEYVRSIVREYPMKHGIKEISNVILGGVSIEHGYIITANPDVAPAAMLSAAA